MKSNILFAMPNKTELAVLTVKLQGAYDIHVADGTKGLTQVIAEKIILANSPCLICCLKIITELLKPGVGTTGPIQVTRWSLHRLFSQVIF
jgi:hypothetical protein